MNAFTKTVLMFSLFEFVGDVPTRFPHILRSLGNAKFYNATGTFQFFELV
jgi:hypothetical protein